MKLLNLLRNFPIIWKLIPPEITIPDNLKLNRVLAGGNGKGIVLYEIINGRDEKRYFIHTTIQSCELFTDKFTMTINDTWVINEFKERHNNAIMKAKRNSKLLKHYNLLEIDGLYIVIPEKGEYLCQWSKM